MFVVGVDWVRMNAKGASFAHLHISPRSAIRSESPGNSFSPTYVRGGLPYLAGSPLARGTDRQTDTRLVSINHQRSDSAAEEKSPLNERNRALGRPRRPMRAPLSRHAGPIGEVIRKIGKKKCAIRADADGRGRE